RRCSRRGPFKTAIVQDETSNTLDSLYTHCQSGSTCIHGLNRPLALQPCAAIDAASGAGPAKQTKTKPPGPSECSTVEAHHQVERRTLTGEFMKVRSM